ncbi:MAG TPA: L-2-hydroxyglutarate oxidase [Solirubrobacteraceae bacterium]|nr:L-2-hydroxyglutarate oxidase [Solirubrobacteraceae bacterium]
MSEAELAVVGAGIVGLAVARELARRDAGRRVVVLEREDRVAAHQTGHNSGVAHAGIYYAPGSLKALLCVAGVRELAAYCEARGLAYERCGKLIVALERGELAALDELARRGAANGVPGLRRLDAAGVREIEPHAAGIAALHSPETAIVDFAAVARALAEDLRDTGGEIVTGARVHAVDVRAAGRRIVLHHSRGELAAGFAVFCAGAWSDRLAVLAGAGADPRIVPFRGAYMRLVDHRRELVRGLIYPVPDPRLPFLGVHLTRHLGGDVLIGPTALLAPGRSLSRTLRWPGTWRMARRWWRTGLTELHHALSPAALTRAAARYVPELEPGDAEPAWAGVRAQAVARDGRLVDDFAFSHTERALHVRNAPSPAGTAALAIARHVADEAERAL